MKFSIFDKNIKINNSEELELNLEHRFKEKFVAFWLERPNQNSMALFINGEHSCMFFIREPGDPGFHSISENPNWDETLEFVIDNYQLDEYPLAMVVPTKDAKKELIEFYKTGNFGKYVDWFEL